MSDQAHDWTDDRIDELSEKMRKQYQEAAKEMQAKLDTWLEDYDRRRKVWEDDVSSGRRTQDEYDAWLKGRAFDKSWQQEMIDTLSYDAMNTDRLAMDAINDELPRIYAENANFTAYTIDKGIGMNTGFTLVDQDTVRRLMMDNPDLVPAYRIDQPKDYVWNQQKFNSAITQGILQGESIPDISKRVESVIGMDRRAATRSARTACTAAESMGRQSSYKRAQDLGIGLKQQWMATLDLRTRYTHRLLDKQTVPVGQKFCPKGYGEKHALRFPADPQGLAEEVFGCRCTTIAVLDDEDYEDDERWSKLPEGMTYEEWQGLNDQKKADKQPSDGNPETLAGVKRGKPMTFKQANELRGNPNYSMAEEPYRKYQAVRRKYNEVIDEYGFSSQQFKDVVIELGNVEDAYKQALKEQSGYRVNCQTCVVANEARRRGYDVEATPNPEISGEVHDKVARRTNLAWIDPETGKQPEYIRYEGVGKTDVIGRPIPTQKRYFEWLTSDGTIEEGARYTIEFSWKGRSRYGHIVSIERTDNGLRMYDPQCGRTYDEVGIADYLKRVKYKTTSYGNTYADGPILLKVSDYQFNTSICDQILTGAGQ